MKLEKFEGRVYVPREDSFELKSVVDGLVKKGMKVLDMGCGSGIQGISSALKGGLVTCTDLNPSALTLTEKNASLNNVKVKIVFSDLMNSFGENDSFDLIIFNPPYLPANPMKYLDLDGGVEGYEVSLKFLSQVKNFLSKNGEILLSISTLTNPKIVEKAIIDEGFSFEIVREKKFSFETLIIYLIKTRLNV